MFRMHSAHLANVSKSVTKKCYISQNWGTPLFDNTAAASPTVVGGTHFLYLSNPPSGIPVPIIPWLLWSKSVVGIIASEKNCNLVRQ